MQTTWHTRVTHKLVRSFWFSFTMLAVLALLAACGGSTTAAGGTTPTTAPTTAATSAPTTAPTTAPANTPTTSGNGSAVTITTDSSGSFAFSPSTLTVKVGTTVVWTNMTQAPHTVTSDDGKTFDSGSSNPVSPQGGTFKFTFTKPGTYTYHCQFHPYMKATIIVQ